MESILEGPGCLRKTHCPGALCSLSTALINPGRIVQALSFAWSFVSGLSAVLSFVLPTVPHHQSSQWPGQVSVEVS
jgi:hypothetical protein